MIMNLNGKTLYVSYIKVYGNILFNSSIQV